MKGKVQKGNKMARLNTVENVKRTDYAVSKPKFLGRKSVRRVAHALLVYSILIGLGFIVLLPLSWMLTAALKGRGEAVFTVPVSWFPTGSLYFENFWIVMTNPAYPLWRPLVNTLFLVCINIIGVVISNTLVAYAFARLNFPYKEFLFRVLILTMLMPYVVLLIPQFLLFNTLGWYGTYLPLWVPSFFGSAFYIFITRQYMRSFPKDLDDAARIDGANHLQIYWHIILPLSKPVITVMAIFTFQDVWNDFQGPLIYLNDASKFTLAIGLNYFNQSSFSAGVATTNLLMAGALLSVIPILVLYFALQKQLIGGIASLGLKG
jgi:multiple sugar transport system permease protein